MADQRDRRPRTQTVAPLQVWTPGPHGLWPVRQFLCIMTVNTAQRSQREGLKPGVSDRALDLFVPSNTVERRPPQHHGSSRTSARETE